MTPVTPSRWMPFGLAMLLAIAPQALLAETDRPSAGAPTPIYPVSFEQPVRPVIPSAGSPVTTPIYRPPHRLAPAQGVRVSGGTRAVSGAVPAVTTLVPGHTGLTAQPSPTFYWYTASASTLPVEFVLTHESTGLPVLEVSLPHSPAAGIHAVHMAEYGITLNDGERYTWSVALVPDSNRRSRDVMAFGSIVRLTAAADQPARAETDSIEAYAGAGLWYDALHAAARLFATTPADSTLRAREGALLRQVGLADVADYVESAAADALTLAN